MATLLHLHDWPDRAVIGTVGRPGARTFYLQARTGRRLTSVAMEKQWAATLAEKIDEFLDELMATDGNPFSIPESTPAELVDNDPLEQPVDARFRTGAMSLGWDPSTSQVVIEAYAMSEVDEADDDEFWSDPADAEPAEVLQVQIPVGAARAFAKRTLEVVGAGRPLCPFCGTPVDPEGHVCPVPGAIG